METLVVLVCLSVSLYLERISDKKSVEYAPLKETFRWLNLTWLN